ncbi:GNAT family N-acetyltransferase [Clostridium sp. B9]|uniref:GNAT family N-acetyltransferase n=1 Tax=Clostridium sp. B9 TaxID=3423224 RepID=UPI003D2EB6A3
MGKNIDLRKVKVGDEKVLAYIQTESWKAAFGEILSREEIEKFSDVKKAEEMYSMLLKEDIGNGYILSVGGKPHCIAYWNDAREENMKGYAELICIHSLAENWGVGYGSIMMEYILEEVRRAGFKDLILWVFEENSRARKFYEKYGFVLTEKSKMFSNAKEVMYYKSLVK